MNVRITPQKLCGSILVPPSKSVSHRALICSALCSGKSTIHNLLDCEDTWATIDALNALGADIKFENGTADVNGISIPSEKADIFCRESGSTLRFMIPVAAALGAESSFSGAGKLPERPITPYFDEFPNHGAEFLTKEMPYKLKGKLTAGDYKVRGDISSQFITGYMTALPLCGGESRITLTSELQSKPYADLTADVMKSFGVTVNEDENGYVIPAGQNYTAREFTVEADMSQAAFFLVADAIGGNVTAANLRQDSVQGDREIIDIVKKFSENGGKAFDIDAQQIPDLVPILTVLACFADGVSHITGCERLRIKESDRLAAISEELNKLGAKVTAGADYLEITGVKSLNGGICDAHNDHRIAMSIAVASQRCTSPVVINGAECVAKSYPHFYEDFRKLGGIADVI